jgi:hypothetical protein
VQELSTLASLVATSGLAHLDATLLLSTGSAAVLLAAIARSADRSERAAAAAVENALGLLGATARPSGNTVAGSR